MILEVELLEEFESTFKESRKIISNMKGSISSELKHFPIVEYYESMED